MTAPRRKDGTPEAPLVGGLVRASNLALATVGRVGWRLPEPDADHLVAAATRSHTRSHIDEAIRSHVASAIQSMREDGGLTPFGRWSAHAILKRMLNNAQAIGSYLDRHPSVASEPISRPVIVVGLYRSGTTLLHRLLASAPGALVPRAAELYFPLVGNHTGRALDIARRRRMRRMLTLAHLAIPDLARLHRIDVDSPEEATALLDNAGLGVYFIHAFGAHAHGDRLAAADLTPAYRAMRTQLQLLQHLGSRRGRWILKCPFSLGHLRSVLDVFPDADVVWIHRDPALSLSSVCRLSATLQASFRARVSRADIGAFWHANYRDTLERAGNTRRQCRPGSIIDIDYRQIVTHPDRTMAAIGERLDLEFPASRIAEALGTTRNAGAPLPHALADFGLMEEEIRDELARIATERNPA